MATRTTYFDRFHVTIEDLHELRDRLCELDQPNDDRGVVAITVERPQIQASAPHATSSDVAAQLAIGGPINDEAALAIASWYQSPRGQGQTFAMLAQGSRVAVDELDDAIAAELVIVTDPEQRPELEALARWAEGVVDQN